ncbi:MAG: methylated-DNA--[protein]-cysteine S-methyltransferase [Candidatus Thorarchaeota archaeon]|nr:methylated-DNA--[protein]-cysteine S-methyltransferase [Candidatus Thorarchaeota archaeon]
MMYFTLVETSLGYVSVIHREITKDGIVGVVLPRTKKDALKAVQLRYPHARASSNSFDSVEALLVDYFNGGHVKFPLDVLDFSVCYPFQIEVLKAEWSIPYGKVASYGSVARKIDSTAYRAVGNALARNPFPIIIPCHRAIRTDRTLGGFQGGLEMKRRILEMEGVRFDSKGRVLPRFIMKNNPENGPIGTGLHFSETSWLL